MGPGGARDKKTGDKASRETFPLNSTKLLTRRLESVSCEKSTHSYQKNKISLKAKFWAEKSGCE